MVIKKNVFGRWQTDKAGGGGGGETETGRQIGEIKQPDGSIWEPAKKKNDPTAAKKGPSKTKIEPERG